MPRTTSTTRNGAHVETPPMPMYVPQQGRAPRKEKEPVRTGLTQSLRTLKEIMSNWGTAVAHNGEGRVVLTSPEAAALCSDHVKHLVKKLNLITVEIDKRIAG